MKPTDKGANTHKIILENRKSMYFDSSDADQDKNAFTQFLAELEKDIKKYKRDQLHELYTSKATEVEKKIIDDMLGAITDPHTLSQFILGAHVELEGDNAAFYEDWIAKNVGKKEFVVRHNSSHKSDNQQFGLNGAVIGHILIGTRTKNGKQYTWIQLENNPTGGFKEFLKSPIKFLIHAILHLLDYLNYKITKKNIGRWGKSSYTEANPLRIDCSVRDKNMEQQRKTVWNTVIFEKRGMIDASDVVLMKEVGIKIDSREEKLKSSKN